MRNNAVIVDSEVIGVRSGQVALSMDTGYGSATVHVDRKFCKYTRELSGLLRLLCDVHHYVRALTARPMRRLSRLTLYVDGFAPRTAELGNAAVVLREVEFERVLRACARQRVDHALVKEIGYLLQRRLGLDHVTAWPAFVEGTAALLGAIVVALADRQPTRGATGGIETADAYRKSFVQSGLRLLHAGYTPREGILDRGASIAAELLEAALFDLVYRCVGSERPLLKALSQLSKSRKRIVRRGPSANVEMFFTTLGIAAHADISTYLEEWNLGCARLSKKLAHLPKLAVTLPPVDLPAESQASTEPDAPARTEAHASEDPFSQVGVEAVTVACGTELAALLFGELTLDSAHAVRDDLAYKTGIVLTGVHFRDDLYLGPMNYEIFIRDRVVAAGRVPEQGMSGTEDPSEPLSVVMAQLETVLQEHMRLLFGRKEFAALFNHLRAAKPALANALETTTSIYVMHKAYGLLLQERVWPRDFLRTFETFLDVAQTSNDPVEFAEAARKHLVPAMLRHAESTTLRVAILEPGFKAACSTPSFLEELQKHLKTQLLAYAISQPENGAFVVCSPAVRPALAALLQDTEPRVRVYARDEIPATVSLEILETIKEREWEALP